MTVNHKGIPIYFQDRGKGKAIILLHGFLENSTMWSEISKQLVLNNRVITIDLLGHGKTGCIGYIHTMKNMAEAVNAVIQKLRLQRITIIGHSMGGYVALAFSKLYTSKVKGLILMNSTAREDGHNRRQLRNEAIAFAKKRYRYLVNTSIQNLFSENSQSIYRKEIEHLKQQALKTPIQGYVAAQEGMKIRPNSESWLKNAPFKTYYLIGREDPILKSQTIIAEAKSNTAEIQVLNGGHMLHIEDKEVFSYFILHIIENI